MNERKECPACKKEWGLRRIGPEHDRWNCSWCNYKTTYTPLYYIVMDQVNS